MEIFTDYSQDPPITKRYLRVIGRPDGYWFHAEDIARALRLPKNAVSKIPELYRSSALDEDQQKVIVVNETGALWLLARSRPDDEMHIMERIPAMVYDERGEPLGQEFITPPRRLVLNGFASALSLARHAVDERMRESEARAAVRDAAFMRKFDQVEALTAPTEAPSVP